MSPVGPRLHTCLTYLLTYLSVDNRQCRPCGVTRVSRDTEGVTMTQHHPVCFIALRLSRLINHFTQASRITDAARPICWFS